MDADEKGAVPTYTSEFRRGSKAEIAKETQLGEAAEIYGDIETAEDYGYVSRGYVHAVR